MITSDVNEDDSETFAHANSIHLSLCFLDFPIWVYYFKNQCSLADFCCSDRHELTVTLFYNSSLSSSMNKLRSPKLEKKSLQIQISLLISLLELIFRIKFDLLTADSCTSSKFSHTSNRWKKGVNIEAGTNYSRMH